MKLKSSKTYLTNHTAGFTITSLVIYGLGGIHVHTHTHTHTYTQNQFQETRHAASVPGLTIRHTCLVKLTLLIIKAPVVLKSPPGYGPKEGSENTMNTSVY